MWADFVKLNEYRILKKLVDRKSKQISFHVAEPDMLRVRRGDMAEEAGTLRSLFESSQWVIGPGKTVLEDRKSAVDGFWWRELELLEMIGRKLDWAIIPWGPCSWEFGIALFVSNGCRRIPPVLENLVESICSIEWPLTPTTNWSTAYIQEEIDGSELIRIGKPTSSRPRLFGDSPEMLALVHEEEIARNPDFIDEALEVVRLVKDGGEKGQLWEYHSKSEEAYLKFVGKRRGRRMIAALGECELTAIEKIWEASDDVQSRIIDVVNLCSRQNAVFYLGETGGDIRASVYSGKSLEGIGELLLDDRLLAVM